MYEYGSPPPRGPQTGGNFGPGPGPGAGTPNTEEAKSEALALAIKARKKGDSLGKLCFALNMLCILSALVAPWLMYSGSSDEAQKNLPTAQRSSRYYGLFWITGGGTTSRGWYAHTAEVCKTAGELGTNNPLSAALGVVTEAAKDTASTLHYNSWAAGGCAAWPLCVKGAKVRCQAYGSFANMAAFSLATIFCAFVALCIWFFKWCQEARMLSTGNLKDLGEAKLITLVLLLITIVLMLTGVVTWYVTIRKMFGEIGKSQWYPIPGRPMPGLIMGGLSPLMLLVPLAHQIGRLNDKKEGKPSSNPSPEFAPPAEGPGQTGGGGVAGPGLGGGGAGPWAGGGGGAGPWAGGGGGAGPSPQPGRPPQESGPPGGQPPPWDAQPQRRQSAGPRPPWE